MIQKCMFNTCQGHLIPVLWSTYFNQFHFTGIKSVCRWRIIDSMVRR